MNADFLKHLHHDGISDNEQFAGFTVENTAEYELKQRKKEVSDPRIGSRSMRRMDEDSSDKIKLMMTFDEHFFKMVTLIMEQFWGSLPLNLSLNGKRYNTLKRMKTKTV